MGSLVADLAEKLSSATNNLDFDEQTMFLNTSADTVGIGTNSPASKLDVRGTMQVGVNDTGYDVKFFGDTSGNYWLWDTSADGTVQVGNSQLTGTLTVGVDDTGHDVKFFGATATNGYMLWDESTDDLILGSSSNMLLGITAPETVAGAVSKLHVEAVDATAQISVWRNSADNASSSLVLGKSRGAGLSSDTIIADNDMVGRIYFAVGDGTDRGSNVAEIRTRVNGTPGANDTPGELILCTTADGASSSSERINIMNDGKVGISTDDPQSLLDVRGTVQVGVNDTGYDVKFFGDTSGNYWLWDTSADGTVLVGSSTQTGNAQLTGTLTVGVDGTGHNVVFYGDTSGRSATWSQGNDALSFTDGTAIWLGTSHDMKIYHDATNSYITNAVGALKIATETSGIAVTIGHTTSEVTIADNLTVTGTLTNADIILNNLKKDEPNMFDGTRGHWQIQEGSDDLFIMNHVTGKKYKFSLTEVS